MSLNQQEQIAPHRMVLQKHTIINWPSGLGHFYMAPTYQFKYWSAALLHAVYLNNRLVHTVKKRKCHLKVSMAINRTSSISKCLDLACVLSNLGISGVNWIVMTLRAYFQDTQHLITISDTWIWNLNQSKPVIMRCLTRHSSCNQNDHLLHNYYTTLDWRLRIVWSRRLVQIFLSRMPYIPCLYL